MAESGNGRRSIKDIFDLRITLAHAIVLLSMIAGGIWLAARGEAHMSSNMVHSTEHDRNAEFDSRFEVRVEPLKLRISNMEQSVRDLAAEQRATAQRLSDGQTEIKNLIRQQGRRNP